MSDLEAQAEDVESDEPEPVYKAGEEIAPWNDPLNPMSGGGASEDA